MCDERELATHEIKVVWDTLQYYKGENFKIYDTYDIALLGYKPTVQLNELLGNLLYLVRIKFIFKKP